MYIRTPVFAYVARAQGHLSTKPSTGCPPTSLALMLHNAFRGEDLQARRCSDWSVQHSEGEDPGYRIGLAGLDPV